MADKDRSGAGAQAAEKLKARMEENGLAAFIFMPEDEIPEGAKGIDWNDVFGSGARKVSRDLFNGWRVRGECLKRGIEQHGKLCGRI